MRPTFPSSRCLPPQETNMSPLSRTRVERRSRWPAGAGAARVHRRSKTSTRPLFVRSSRAPSRPRAPLRLLQMHVSASTTTDHSNIPDHRKAVGTTAGSTESCLSIATGRRRYAGSGAENTESRHSPPGLLTVETSPRPRSLRAPPVASTTCFPVRSDVGRGRCRHLQRTLAGHAPR